MRTDRQKHFKVTINNIRSTNMRKKFDRLFIIIVSLSMFTLVLSTGFTQDAEIKIEKIKGNLYQLRNVPGGNVVASIGQDGVLMVDAGTNPDDVQRIESAIAAYITLTVRKAESISMLS